jgi:fatty-acyl-CoA synthase
MIYLLLDRALKDGRRPRSLETIIYGAAPMSAARLKQGLEVFGPVFMQLYGQTEAPLCLTVLGREEHRLDRPELLNSCGRPVAGMQLALLDDEGRRVPEGEPGEICVRGPIVMDGYLNRPDETAEALRFGWLHTGDIGRFDAEGYLYIVDRKKDMIISGGFNVYPREIEALLDRHPAVLQSAVVGVPDPKWGEAVTAVVVRRPDQEVTAQQLIEHVKAVQGSVSAPKSVVFVDSLPLTPLGKPDKKAVRAAFARGG